MFGKSSIEEKMEILKQNKSALANAIEKTDPDFLKNLSWEDFNIVF